jgi:glycosyltransferase 2 family protein
MTDAPPSHRPHVRRALIAIVLAVAVYAGIIVFIDGRELLRVIRHFQFWAFGAALGVAIAAFALRTLRWFVYLRRLRVFPGALTFRESLGMALTTGKAGHAVKSYYLNEGAQVPFTVSIPAGLAERMSDVIAVILLLFIGLALSPKFDTIVGLLTLAALVLITLIVTLKSEKASALAVRLLRRWKRTEGAADHLANAHANLVPMLHVKPMAAPVALGLAGFALEATALWLLATQGLHVRITWAECAFTLGAVDIVGTISLLPGGLGVIDGSLVGMMLLLDVELAEAGAIALLFRVCTLWLSGLLDLTAFVMLRGLRAPGRILKEGTAAGIQHKP